MMSTSGKLLAFVAASKDRDPMYQLTVSALTWLGFLAGALFTCTYVPSAFSRRARGAAHLSFLEALDFAGPPIGIFLLYVLGVINLAKFGVPYPHNLGIETFRLLTVLLFDAIVVIRFWRWTDMLRDPDGVALILRRRRRAFSKQRALEGTSDDQNQHSSQPE